MISYLGRINQRFFKSVCTPLRLVNKLYCKSSDRIYSLNSPAAESELCFLSASLACNSSICSFKLLFSSCNPLTSPFRLVFSPFRLVFSPFRLVFSPFNPLTSPFSSRISLSKVFSLRSASSLAIQRSLTSQSALASSMALAALSYILPYDQKHLT